MIIEPHLQRLLTTHGFICAFWEMSGEYRTQPEAYEAVEILHEQTFGKRKYKDYESFRVTMQTFLKREKSKTN